MRHAGQLLTIIYGTLGILVTEAGVLYPLNLGHMAPQAKLTILGATLLLCVVAALFVKVVSACIRDATVKGDATSKVEIPHLPPKPLTRRDEEREEFKDIVDFLKGFLDRAYHSSPHQVLLRLGDDCSDCLPIVGEIERRFAVLQESQDVLEVQAQTLQDIGEELDKLIDKLGDRGDELLRKSMTEEAARIEGERHELKTRTDVLCNKLGRFCENHQCDFNWRYCVDL